MSTDRINQHPGNSLDLLRLLFASLVLLSHAPELIDGNRSRELFSRLTHGTESFGEVGVAGFFGLSGYLIMASWCRRPRLRHYFRNRILRIYPGFIVAFCISVLIVGPLASADVAAYFARFSWARFEFSVATLRDPWFALSFDGMHYRQVNGAMWTISYEFFCYIAVAFVGWGARQHLRVVWLALTAVLLVIACFQAVLESLPPVGHFGAADFVRMSTTFFVGASLHLVKFTGFKTFRSLAAVVILLLVSSFSYRLHVVGLAVFGTLFFLSIGLARFEATFTSKWPDISYGTYLYGWPAIQLVIWSQPQLGPWSVFAISLIASLACGYLSWTLVEAPFMRFKATSGHASAVT